ncbi:MAG TPA: class I SAM-dependent methyltransferase [Mycobacteriales bacterium]|jgi:trans-aconitate 2-methyltransferase|nr:class I SAM-dependent methyltransferase [Mycobacteriales bacterium]
MELLEWDAHSYDALPLPHTRWGAGVLDRLALQGDETVLDIGCGTGRDTQQLLLRLPRGRVFAVDGSRQMLAALRDRLPTEPRLSAYRADLREDLGLPQIGGRTVPLDAAMSVATLHWLPDHEPLFVRLHEALRPGGMFVAECGGAGNIAAVRTAVAAVAGSDGAEVWNFADADTTGKRLDAVGFRDVETALVPDPARLERGEQLEAYLATVVLGPHVRALPAPERRPFVRAVAAQLAEPEIDYVRLRIRARA